MNVHKTETMCSRALFYITEKEENVNILDIPQIDRTKIKEKFLHHPRLFPLEK